MRHALFVSLLALACISGCASRRDNYAERPYIGTWYAQGQENSYTWKLDSDGSFGKSTGYVTPKTDDGSWRVDRGDLILNVKDRGKKSCMGTLKKFP